MRRSRLVEAARMGESGRCTVCGPREDVVPTSDGHRCPLDLDGTNGHVVGLTGLDVAEAELRPRVSAHRRYQVLARCGYLCVFCRLALRLNGGVGPAVEPTPDVVFPRPGAVVAVADLEETLASREDVDTLFPLDAHEPIKKNTDQSRRASVWSGLRDRWLVAACGRCRAGRRQQWDDPGVVLAVYASHLYTDTVAGHADLVELTAALGAYRYARVLRAAELSAAIDAREARA